MKRDEAMKLAENALEQLATALEQSPEFLECTKRHARAPLLTAAIGFRCVKGCG